ncbi:hypothetical protein M9Y10_025453 [Tritrichomonas musculus]|uniref:Uncharacterized protein n=1 Tax=Tritrichomonas musculus TaxID=1915356 RepID=A0ABR2H8Q2_9EUKA
MEQLQRQLEELRKRRQEIIQKRNAEFEAIKELAVAPEPTPKKEQIEEKKEKEQHLSIERPIDQDTTLNPVQHALYTRSTQADFLPNPVVVEKKPDVKISIDEQSEKNFEYVSEESIQVSNDQPTLLNFGPTSDYQIIWSSPQDNRRFPSSIDWCMNNTTFAVAVRQFSTTGEGIVSVRNAKTPQNSIDLRIPSQPTTVKFVPRTTDLILVGSISGQIYLYDKRSSTDSPVAQTQRWNSCHYAQIISTIFTVQRQFLSIAADGTFFTWDLDSLGSCLSKDPLPNSEAQMIRPTCAVINDLNKVVIGFEDGLVASRSINKESQLEEITRSTGPITGLSFRQSSRGFRSALAVSSIDCTLSVFSGEKMTKEIALITGSFVGCEWRPTPLSTSTTVSPVLAALKSDNKVSLYDIAQDDERSFQLPAMGCCTSFSGEGNMLCVGCIDGSYHLVNCP